MTDRSTRGGRARVINGADESPSARSDTTREAVPPSSSEPTFSATSSFLRVCNVFTARSCAASAQRLCSALARRPCLCRLMSAPDAPAATGASAHRCNSPRPHAADPAPCPAASANPNPDPLVQSHPAMRARHRAMLSSVAPHRPHPFTAYTTRHTKLLRKRPVPSSRCPIHAL